MIEIREFREPEMIIRYQGKTVCVINNELTLLDILIQIKEQQVSGFTITIPECEVEDEPIDVNGRFNNKGFVSVYEVLLRKLLGF